MKFKANLTDVGIDLLEKRFIPAFEKIGKICHVYLTPEYIYLAHNILNTDGLQAVAQITKDAAFGEYLIASANEDCIAFTIDLTLFGRALKSSVNMDGETLQVKLVKKRASLTESAKPYLCLESKGYRSAIVQDVPISKPLSREEAQEVQVAIDSLQDLPATLVALPDLVQLQALADRLKNVGDIVDVAVTEMGDLHLRVLTPFVSIGTEYRKLKVVGRTAQDDAASSDPTATPSARLQHALEQGVASAVKVNVKHLAKALHCQITKPDWPLCGVTEGEGSLLVAVNYFIPGTHQVDESYNMCCRLPVLNNPLN